MRLEDFIEVIPDFPKKGVQFKDVTSLMQNGEAYKECIRQMTELVKEMKADVIVGPESRGFMFGCPVAVSLGVGFVPVRKPGKLPRETISQTYELEYGVDTLEMHKDSIKKGQRVVIVDDIVAVGGTMDAIIKMVERVGGELVGMVALMGLTSLPGVEKLTPKGLKCLIYDDVKDE
ncbi:MAG: adenine phosphoribosyltransferase [Erysipelotrichaceae bacterium]|nr:adenine phosphoribosyltransferase [Erysipelotrichaceae bacterium]